MKGPIFNQDDSEFCASRAPEQISGEAVDAWVDGLARAGVGTLVSCVCAMTTNYASKVWETRWSRYDPAGPDDQPVLKHLPRESVARTRRWLESEKRLAELGINFHERAFARCRKHGLGAWASIRMNDLHDCHLPDSPLLSTFYKTHRDQNLIRVPYRYSGWPDRALNYGRQDVRDYTMALVREVLGFRGIEGLELDWMRFGYHFQIGKELEGGRILTEWIGEVRGLCRQAAEREGHPVLLGCRVPSTPETARSLGLDGAAWAKEGLIDLLVPTPFWATCEFNMPIRTWARLLEGTGCALAGGLEIRYQPMPGGPAIMNTPELASGAAMAVLNDGADQVYLFNYFFLGHLQGLWTEGAHRATLAALRDVERLDPLPRRHVVTYRDVLAPGEAAAHPLPATAGLCQFRLKTGPKPVGRTVEVVLEMESAPADPANGLRVRVNSVPCPAPRSESPAILTYAVPDEALADDEHVIEVECAEATPVRLTRVEVVIGPADQSRR